MLGSRAARTEKVVGRELVVVPNLENDHRRHDLHRLVEAPQVLLHCRPHVILTSNDDDERGTENNKCSVLYRRSHLFAHDDSVLAEHILEGENKPPVEVAVACKRPAAKEV